MSRSNRHKEKYRESSEISQNHSAEGTCARTRPCSFDEIMSKRKNKKQSENGKERALEDSLEGGIVHKVSDESDHGHKTDFCHSGQKHMSDEHMNASSRNKEENTTIKDKSSAKVKDRAVWDSDSKSRAKPRKDLRHEPKGKVEDKPHRRKSCEQPSDGSEYEPVKKHSRDLMEKDRHVNRNKGQVEREWKRTLRNGVEKSQDMTSSRDLMEKDRHVDKNRGQVEKESKRTLRNGVEKKQDMNSSRDLMEKDRHVDKNRGQIDKESRRTQRNGVEKNHDMDSLKRYDQGMGHNLKTSERKRWKGPHYEELGLKRRRSKSRERKNRNRSISLSPRAQKRVSYHGREHGDMSSHFHDVRSGRQHSDDRSKMMNNGSSSYYRKHDGSTSGLGGYSPRKRRSEAAVRTPSPAKCSPEKKSAKWDVAPEGRDVALSTSVSSNIQSSNQTASSNIREVVNAVPVASSMVKPLSGVSLSVLSTNMTHSIDSIQLTQSTRPMRRLYVENVPASASEKAVMECLNNLLISSGLNHIQGTQPCISCSIHKEKGQALVEFLTPGDASAALSFDGNPFSGSILKIRRPKDYVEVATGETEKLMVAIGAISDTVQDSPHKIFVGGISKALSSKMLMEIVSAFGPLKAYQFQNSEDLNEACAFLEYANKSTTLKACAGLNGMKLGGQVITAVQAVPNAPSWESSGNPPFCGIPEHAKPLLEQPMQVLKLGNVLDPEVLSSLSHTEIEEVLEDVRLECSRFGTVKAVNVVGAIPISSSETWEVDDDMVSAGDQQHSLCDDACAKDENLVDVNQNILEGNNFDVDKPASDVMVDEPCQLGQFDSEMAVEDLAIKSTSDSQEVSQQQQHHASKDEPGCSDARVIDNAGKTEDISMGSKLMAAEELDLQEVSEELKEAKVDGGVGITLSDAIDKGKSKEQDLNPGDIFEPACVLVEFARTEASCMAAHCLHGRLFDGRVVSVQYVPLDIYRTRFPK